MKSDGLAPLLHKVAQGFVIKIVNIRDARVPIDRFEDCLSIAKSFQRPSSFLRGIPGRASITPNICEIIDDVVFEP